MWILCILYINIWENYDFNGKKYFFDFFIEIMREVQHIYNTNQDNLKY